MYTRFVPSVHTDVYYELIYRELSITTAGNRKLQLYLQFCLIFNTYSFNKQRSQFRDFFFFPVLCLLWLYSLNCNFMAVGSNNKKFGHIFCFVFHLILLEFMFIIFYESIGLWW